MLSVGYGLPVDFSRLSIVGDYHFNYDFLYDNSTVAYDFSRNLNKCLLKEMNEGLDNGSSGWISSGKYGKAIEYDGSNDYLDCGNDASLDTSVSGYNYYNQTNVGIILDETQHSGTTSPHTASVVRPNATGKYDGHTYWIYVGEQGNGNIDLWYAENLTNASDWTTYGSNPIISGNEARWATVLYENNEFWMVHTLEYASGGYSVMKNSSDGITFNVYDNVTNDFTDVQGRGYFNPFLLKGHDDVFHLVFQYDDGSVEQTHIRSSSTIQGLVGASTTTIGQTTEGIYSKAPSMFYRDNLYWLLTEGDHDSNWNTYAYYNTEPNTSSFLESVDSSILTDNTACPFPYIEGDILYDFVCYEEGGSTWKLALHTSDLTESLTEYTDSTNDLTVEAWIKTSMGGSGGIISKDSGNGLDKTWLLYKASGSDSIVFYVTNSTESWSAQIEGTTTVHDGNWHYIVGVYQSPNTLKLYIDGTEEGSLVGTVPPKIRKNEESLVIGKWMTSEFDGIIDEAGVWNRAFSDAEVLERYNERLCIETNPSVNCSYTTIQYGSELYLDNVTYTAQTIHYKNITIIR